MRIGSYFFIAFAINLEVKSILRRKGGLPSLFYVVMLDCP